MPNPAPITTPSTEGQPASPARAAVDVIAVTTRDDFLLELGDALGGQASVSPVESTAQALEGLGNSKRLQILVIDSRDLPDIRADVNSVQAQVPQIAVLVFAESAAEQQVADALKGSKVFAVLPVPVDARKTAAVFGGAVADSKARQAAHSPAEKGATIVFEPAAPATQEPIRPAPRDDSGHSKINLRIAGGVALAVLAAIALWFLTRDNGAEPAANAGKTTPVAAQGKPAEAPPPAIETSLVKGKVDELLEKARQAMRERHYTEPTGANALLYYRSAAYADATNGEALDGLTRVASVLAARFEEAMAKGHDEEAAVTLAQFKSAVPSDARGNTFQLQLTKWRAEVARAQEEARQKKLAEERATREAAAVEQKKVREARAAAAETERKAQLVREKDIEEQLKAAQASKTAQQPAKTAQNSATRGSAAALQSSLKRKRYVAPEYPEEALAKGVGGVVTIAFTVDIKGEPQDIRVESAEPVKMFDRAAIAAVKRWRYEPLVIDGVPTEVPARTALRFAPPQ